MRIAKGIFHIDIKLEPKYKIVEITSLLYNLYFPFQQFPISLLKLNAYSR